MKRNHEIKLRLTDAEFVRLNELAEKAGCSREAFLRDMLAGVRIKEKPPVEVMPMIMQIRRVGIAIYGIWKQLSKTESIDMPELRSALESNRAMEKEIIKIYAPYREEQ